MIGKARATSVREADNTSVLQPECRAWRALGRAGR